MTTSIGQFLGLDRARVADSSGLALAVASLFDVGNAYWAAMPTWVASQPSRGLLLEHALFRIVGTVLGAGISAPASCRWRGVPYPALALLSAWAARTATAPRRAA